MMTPPQIRSISLIPEMMFIWQHERQNGEYSLGFNIKKQFFNGLSYVSDKSKFEKFVDVI